MPPAGAPARPTGGVRGRRLVSRHARSRGPGAPEPAPRRRGPRPSRPGHARGPGGRHRPAGPGAPRPARLPSRGALLPRGGPHARPAAGRRRRADGHRDPGPGRRGVHARPRLDLRRAALRGDRAPRDPARVAGRRRGRAHGDHRRPAPPGLVRADPRRGRRPHRRPARGAPRAPGGAAGRDERRARGGPGPDRRRRADRAVRGTGAAAARARHARRRKRRAPVRDGRSPDGHRPLQGPAGTRGDTRGRQPSRARDRDDGRHRPGIRADRRGRPGAMVGGVLPDLAGPGARGGRGRSTGSRDSGGTRRPRGPEASLPEARTT